MVLLLFVACAPINPADVVGPDPYHGDAPLLSGLSLRCDPSRSRFTLDVRTTNWTGGGFLWIDGGETQIERHPFSSDKADRDGAWDCLSLTLTTAADPAAATPGSTTRFDCTDELSFLVELKTPDGSAIADCATWGDRPADWARLDDGPTCESPLDTAETPASAVKACDGG